MCLPEKKTDDNTNYSETVKGMLKWCHTYKVVEESIKYQQNDCMSKLGRLGGFA